MIKKKTGNRDLEAKLLNILHIICLCALSTSSMADEVEEEDKLLADFTNSFDFQTLGGAVGRMEAHGNDLMGDMIDKKTGAISFNHTDVSIPGNSG